jgi:hypothetical protein
MPLIKCKDCGHEISPSAKACPQCGAPSPREANNAAIGCLGVIILFAVSFFGASQCTSTPKETNATQEPPEIMTPAKAMESQRMGRAALRMGLLRQHMREPESLKWEAALSDETGDLICLRYRAKNGFGGMNVEVAIFKGDKGYDQESDWKKHCGPATYSVIKAER